MSQHPPDDITQEEARELQDVLRTLTPSGTALLTSARELVARWESIKAEVEHLLAEVARLRDWRAGAEGASAIARPPREGAHTERAFAAHQAAYLTGSKEYRQGADVVSEVDVRRREARAEVERVRAALAEARGEDLEPYCYGPLP